MRCHMCFKDKDNLVILRTKGKATGRKVCKGCWYELDKVLGFLAMSGINVDLDYVSQNQESTNSPQTPIDSETSTEKPPKKKS